MEGDCMTLSKRLLYAALLAIAVLAIPIIADAALLAQDIERAGCSGILAAPRIQKQADV
jgi:hypothetical protein